MQAGRKLAEGTLDELRAQAQMADSTLEQVFLRLTLEAEDARTVVSDAALTSQ